MTRVRDFIEKQQPFSGIVGSALTILVTVVLTLVVERVIVSNEYVSVSSFNVLVKTYFVDTGLISDDVLELKPGEQFSTIASTFSDVINQIDVLQSQNKEMAEKIESLQNENQELRSHLTTAEVDAATLKEMSEKIESLQNENQELRSHLSAEVYAATLIVNGETLDTDIPNSVAIVSGHRFYSETLLGSFLNEPVTFDSSKSVVYFGTERAEKTVFQANMITDYSGFDIYAVGNGNSFTMGTDAYDNGLIKQQTNSSRLYANLKGEYSKISFMVGHIDGTRLENVTLYVYTKNGNEQYRLLKTYELTSDMFPEEKIIEINYADGIQIVIEGSYSAKYALADIYLYR